MGVYVWGTAAKIGVPGAKSVVSGEMFEKLATTSDLSLEATLIAGVRQAGAAMALR